MCASVEVGVTSSRNERLPTIRAVSAQHATDQLHRTSVTMPTVLVVGSTGHVGQATIRALVAKGARVKAGCRNPESEKASTLAALDGVVAVKCDMNEEGTIMEVRQRVWLCDVWPTLTHVLLRVRGHCVRVCLFRRPWTQQQRLW